MTPPLEKWLAEVESRAEFTLQASTTGEACRQRISAEQYCVNQTPLLVKLLRKAIEQRDWHIANYCCDWGEHKEITTENNKEFTAIISDTLGAK